VVHHGGSSIEEGGRAHQRGVEGGRVLGMSPALWGGGGGGLTQLVDDGCCSSFMIMECGSAVWRGGKWLIILLRTTCVARHLSWDVGQQYGVWEMAHPTLQDDLCNV
jgi:hypothetical protein